MVDEKAKDISMPADELAPVESQEVAAATAAEPAQKAAEGQGLLQSIQVPLVVELGRVSLPVMSVGDLKSGQIIELSRLPGDAVDLVVGGKSVGRGELVEIEGEIGVRIISLVK